MTIAEAERVAEVVQSKVSPTARIIWGATVDASLEHTLRVMLVATGVKSKQIVGRRDPSEEKARVGVDVIRRIAPWRSTGGEEDGASPETFINRPPLRECRGCFIRFLGQPAAAKWIS